MMCLFGGGESLSQGMIVRKYDEDALCSYTADVLITSISSSLYVLSL